MAADLPGLIADLDQGTTSTASTEARACDHPRVAALAVKLLLAPAFVIGASLVARRFGSSVGGVLAGLPVVAGPILLVYELQHGSIFAAHAAKGTLLGLLSLTVFVVIYGRLAPRASWMPCVLAGWLAFALGTFALDGVEPPIGLSLVLVLAGFGLGASLLPRVFSGQATAIIRPSWDLPARALCAAALVLTLTALASWLGPRLSGLLAPFPVIATVLAAFTHKQCGAAETIRLLRSMLSGYVAFALFCATLAITLNNLSASLAFALATAAALITQAIVLALTRRSRATIMAELANESPA
jgi:hypothetical protein